MLAVLRAATSNTKTYANAGARADAMSRCHKVDALACCSRTHASYCTAQQLLPLRTNCQNCIDGRQQLRQRQQQSTVSCSRAPVAVAGHLRGEHDVLPPPRPEPAAYEAIRAPLLVR